MLIPFPLTDKEKAQKVLQRYKRLLEEKQPWLPVLELLSEFVLSRKQGFTTQHTPGQFMTGQIFDATAGQALQKAASAIIGILWPGSSKAFRLSCPYHIKSGEDTEEVREYYSWLNTTVGDVFDSPLSGFILAFEEHMKDCLGLGTSGVSSDEDKTNDDVPVNFVAVDVKEATIAEGADNRVDTVYREKRFTVRQLIQRYGFDFVSSKYQAVAADPNGNLDEYVRVLHAIEPRINGIPGAFGNANLPVASIHIEIETAHILQESGFEEMPVHVVRFWKMNGEVYGRCPASEAFPAIWEANAQVELAIVAGEKMLDPPLSMTEDSAAGGNEINLGAGEISIRHVNGRLGDNTRWIEPIITVQEVKSTYVRIDKLDKDIEDAFFLDMLVDDGNQVRRTLGDAIMQDNRTRQALGSVFVRQTSELLYPLIARVVRIMGARNLLGVPADKADEIEAMTGIRPKVIPQAVVDAHANGKETVKITFISPASRIMRAEELKGIEQTLSFFAQTIAPIAPDVMDNFNLDNSAREVQELTGACSAIIRGTDEVQKIRDDRAKQQQQQAKMQADHAEAQTAKSTAQAAEHASKAGLPLASLFQQQGQQPPNGTPESVPA